MSILIFDVKSQEITVTAKINSPHTNLPYNYERFSHFQTAQKEFGHFWELKKPSFRLFIYHWDTTGYYRFKEDTAGRVLYTSHYAIEAGVDSLVDSVSFTYEIGTNQELTGWQRIMLNDSGVYISTTAEIQRDSSLNIQLVSLVDSNNSNSGRRFKKEEYQYDGFGRLSEIKHSQSGWGDTSYVNTYREIFNYDSTGINTHAFQAWDQTQSVFLDSSARRIFGSVNQGRDSIVHLNWRFFQWQFHYALIHEYDSLQRTKLVKVFGSPDPEWILHNAIGKQYFFYEGNELDSISNHRGKLYYGSTHFTRNSQNQLGQIELLMKEFNSFSATDHIWYPSTYTITKPKRPLDPQISLVDSFSLKFTWLDNSEDEIQFWARRRRGNSFVKDWRLPPNSTSLIDTLPFNAFIYSNLDYYVLSRNKYCFSDYSNTARWNGTSAPPYYSIGEQDGTSTIKCYPNPAQDFISLSYEGAIPLTYLEIIGLDGRRYITRDLMGDSFLTLDVQSLLAGKYFMVVRKEGGSFSILPFIKH